MSGDRTPRPGVRLATDYGPLIVFFVVNALWHGDKMAQVTASTAAFMIAVVVAVIVAKLVTGTISPMLWMTAAVVLVFGGLTVYFHDQRFIQAKPSVIYFCLAAVLLFGLLTGRPLLKQLLDQAYPGLSDRGWRQLTINWTIFFAVLGGLNIVLAVATSWDFWYKAHTIGAVALTFLFALANIPMLMKHGLTMDDKTD
jgi:intracellular septation protein